MKVNTWGFIIGEDGKVMPVKTAKTINPDIIASVRAKLGEVHSI